MTQNQILNSFYTKLLGKKVFNMNIFQKIILGNKFIFLILYRSYRIFTHSTVELLDFGLAQFRGIRGYLSTTK